MSLTVAQLIEKLKELPPDAIIVQSKDGEGNSYSPVADMTVGVYLADTSWEGSFTDHDDDKGEMVEAGAEPAVCIWPTN
jgi:hypothetical protein